MIEVRSGAGPTIRLHDLGGEGEPLIICHATGFHGRAYAPLAGGLVGRYHVYAIDFRGHGASDPPADGDFGWGHIRDDLLAAIDHIGATTIKAVGHSLGGGITLMAALARPGIIEAAYLFEPIVIPPEFTFDPGENTMAAAARRRKERFATRDEALMRYARRGSLSILRSDSLAAYVTHGFVDDPSGGVRLACSAESEARTFESAGKLNAKQLGPITAPVTIAVGSTEGRGPSDFAAPTVAGLVNGTLVRYEHLGHFGPLQDPDRVAREILRVFEA